MKTAAYWTAFGIQSAMAGDDRAHGARRHRDRRHPPAIVARELKMRQLRLVPTKERAPDMTFVAGWLVTPDTRMTDHVVAIAGEIAHEAPAGHARPARAGIRPNRLKNERRLS